MRRFLALPLVALVALLAVLRGASLECPVCGEFVLHEGSFVRCPECAMRLHGRLDGAETGVQSGTQAG